MLLPYGTGWRGLFPQLAAILIEMEMVSHGSCSRCGGCAGYFPVDVEGIVQMLPQSQGGSSLTTPLTAEDPLHGDVAHIIEVQRSRSLHCRSAGGLLLIGKDMVSHGSCYRSGGCDVYHPFDAEGTVQMLPQTPWGISTTPLAAADPLHGADATSSADPSFPPGYIADRPRYNAVLKANPVMSRCSKEQFMELCLCKNLRQLQQAHLSTALQLHCKKRRVRTKVCKGGSPCVLLPHCKVHPRM